MKTAGLKRSEIRRWQARGSSKAAWESILFHLSQENPPSPRFYAVLRLKDLVQMCVRKNKKFLTDS